jgi:hypothetical protein
MNIFLDESGKFNDQAVVSFGGVIGNATAMQEFGICWAHCLRDNGLKVLTAKNALNSKRPLSEENPALGLKARVTALMPFILCIRRHFEGIRGVSIDALAFKGLPSHYHKTLGDNPFFTAFLRTVLDAITLVAEYDRLTLICDDEEQMALPMYKLFRRIKIVELETRDKLSAICFADDRFLYGLQAADLIASLLRQESSKIFHGTGYEYGPLFDAIVKQPDESEHIRYVGFALCDKTRLLAVADGLKAL